MATVTNTTCDRCNMNDTVRGPVMGFGNVEREMPYVRGNARTAKRRGYVYIEGHGLCCAQCVNELNGAPTDGN